MQFITPKNSGKNIKNEHIILKSYPDKRSNVRKLIIPSYLAKSLNLQDKTKFSISIEDSNVHIIFNPNIDLPTYTFSKNARSLQINNTDLITILFNAFGVIGDNEKKITVFLKLIEVEPFKNNKVYKLIQVI